MIALPSAHAQQSLLDYNQQDIVVLAAMQQLCNPGIVIVAHGSRSKLKTVRLILIKNVNIRKQTTASRRVENTVVGESLCLEANSPIERDELVQCFSLVLEEVHTQNWRDIYGGPSSDMPSLFNEGSGGVGKGNS